MTTRRTFLKTTSLAALATVRSPTRHSPAALRRAAPDGVRGDDPDLQALAMRALDAAKTAGATYADVRFTTTRRRLYTGGGVPPKDSESIAVGVRALAGGVWGFAATSVWTPAEMVRLGRLATTLSKDTHWPGIPPLELGPPPPAATGSWQTPVKRDPFTAPPEEVEALVQRALSFMNLNKRIVVFIGLHFERQDRTFASTDGTYVTQTIYTSLAGATPHTEDGPSLIGLSVGGGPLYAVPEVSPTGGGYEVVEALDIEKNMPAWLDKASMLSSARKRKFQAFGEYDVVFDAYAMAPIVAGTCGAALEYDRVAGYDITGGGSSYLAPPDKILGAPWAPAAVTITADRTLPRGAATVQWDDEGIVPRPTPLVQEGVIVDYATTREFAAELAAWYQSRGVPVHSNGCASAESALTKPIVHTPNLVLHPGPDANTLDALIAGIKEGFAILGGTVHMDIQQSTGRGTPLLLYPINQGKLGAPLSDAVYTFKSRDLWRNLVALGGVQTAALRGLPSIKGHPNQVAVHSVNAVAARVQKVRLQPADLA